MHFARVHRIAVQTIDLRPFDFAVPVSALDEANHQLLFVAPREVDEVINDKRAALLVGLHHEADAVVAGKVGVGNQRFHQIQREFEAVGFFGVDVDADIVLFAEQEQRFQARQEFRHHPLMLRAGVTRVNGREFDGNAVALVHALPSSVLADGVDGVHIILKIAVGVGLGHRRFAEHIERIAVAHFLPRLTVFQRFLNRLSGNELLAEQTHRIIHPLTDERRATASQHAGERRAERVFIRLRGQLAGNQQPPGGGIDEHRRTVTEVAFPVATGELVGDEAVARRLVWNTQQGFGKTHQRHPFLAGERKLVHQRINAARLAPVLAHLFDQTTRQRLGLACLFLAQLRTRQHIGNGFRLIAAVGIGNGIAQRGLRAGECEHDDNSL